MRTRWYMMLAHNHSLFFLVIIVRMSVTPSHPLFIVNARRPLVSLQDYFSPTAFSYVTMRIVSIRCWKFSDLDYAFNNSCYFTFAMYCTLTAPQRTKLNSALYYTLLAHVYLHLPPIIYHKWFPTLFSGTLFCLFFAVLVSRIFYDSLRLSCELYTFYQHSPRITVWQRHPRQKGFWEKYIRLILKKVKYHRHWTLAES